jgi:YD repeat-containing protein
MPDRSYRNAALAVAAFFFGCMSAGAACANVTYTYDNLGRLASAAYDSGVTIYYSYDPNGNRLTQVVQANSTVGVWGSFNWLGAKW